MAEQRMEKQRGRDRSLTLVDVYDIAADIGKEFENIIDEEGADRVTSLMQKVIAALEQLEILVQKNDTEQMLIEDLRRTIEHLEHEDNKKNDERIRYARDIEQVEEHFKSETKDYLTTIKRLQDENRKLSSSLTAATERDSAFSEDESFIEIDIVNKLQGILEKQREQIRSMENNLAELKSEMEEMKSMNDKLSGSNKDLRRKLRQAQSQLNCLVDERAELQVTLQDQQRETGALIKRLGLANKENEDLARSGGQEPDLRNKIIFDLEDPKRPRFTLAELKDILQERNSLKARVSDLEDELEMYRPGTRCVLLNSRASLSCKDAGCGCEFHSGQEHAQYFPNAAFSNQRDIDSDIDSDGSDLPVQGPLPFEPEDAPWKKGETSGIRKLFAYVTGRVVKVSQNLANAGQELGIQPI
ncbi:RILP-like protein homolog isoform X1 [Eurytemora carolleeae]|uniref:RILP-like protein homolog isoform X1 n=1 Tax=Eurytemora carolleeae TaxID=1294199 RepID=UPI000C78E61C|nr:RILP-like protein homolog isoform X1 [Eurytemora carolleeae]|eukprot:XP_023336507.1 RILP-like protein homolog isoform X1 [Eurytemora affinis]